MGTGRAVGKRVFGVIGDWQSVAVTSNAAGAVCSQAPRRNIRSHFVD